MKLVVFLVLAAAIAHGQTTPSPAAPTPAPSAPAQFGPPLAPPATRPTGIVLVPSLQKPKGAHELKEKQKQLVKKALLQQMTPGQPQKLVAAGVGRFLLKEIATEQGWEYLDFDSFFDLAVSELELDAGDCAPAVALAYLAVSLNGVGMPD